MLNRSRNVLRLMLRSSPDDHEVLRNAVLMAAIEQTGRRPVRSAPVGIPALTSPDAGASQVGGRRHVRECRAWKARNAPIGTSSSPSSVAITRTGTPGPAGTPRSPARTAAAGRPGRDPEAGREQFDQQQQGEEGHHAANAWSCAVMTPAPRHGRPLGWSRPSRGRTPHRRPRRSGSTFLPVGEAGHVVDLGDVTGHTSARSRRSAGSRWRRCCTAASGWRQPKHPDTVPAQVNERANQFTDLPRPTHSPQALPAACQSSGWTQGRGGRTLIRCSRSPPAGCADSAQGYEAALPELFDHHASAYRLA